MGVDNVRAGVTGTNTAVHGTAVAGGLTEGQADAVEVLASMPDAPVAIHRGLTRAATRLAKGNILLEGGEAAKVVATEVGKEVAKEVSEHPGQAAAASEQAAAGAAKAGEALAPNLESFRNATLRGGFSIESISVAEGKLGSGGASLGQTTIEPIRSGRMTIQIAPGQSAYEQSVSIYHEVLEATALDAKNPPAMLRDLSEEDFDLLAYMAQEQFGPATVENLKKLLEAVGF